MSRQDGADLHHVDRSFWKHVEKMDDGRMGCKFCEHKYGKDTAITRIKYHLAGVKGHGVRICAQVPRDVQDAALAAIPIDGRPEKKLKTVAGPLLTGTPRAAGTESRLLCVDEAKLFPLNSGSPSSRLIFNMDMEHHTSLTAIISYLCFNCTPRDIISYSNFLAELFSLLHYKIN